MSLCVLVQKREATVEPHTEATEPLALRAEWLQESAVVFRTFNYVSYNHTNHVLIKNWCFVAYWSLLLLSILHSQANIKESDRVCCGILQYTS